MDFSKQKGNYSYELDKGRELINSWYSDPKVTVSGYISNIEQLITPAYINGSAKRQFLVFLHGQKTKAGILQLCYNSIMKAQGLAVS